MRMVRSTAKAEKLLNEIINRTEQWLNNANDDKLAIEAAQEVLADPVGYADHLQDQLRLAREALEELSTPVVTIDTPAGT